MALNVIIAGVALADQIPRLRSERQPEDVWKILNTLRYDSVRYFLVNRKMKVVKSLHSTQDATLGENRISLEFVPLSAGFALLSL